MNETFIRVQGRPEDPGKGPNAGIWRPVSDSTKPEIINELGRIQLMRDMEKKDTFPRAVVRDLLYTLDQMEKKHE